MTLGDPIPDAVAAVVAAVLVDHPGAEPVRLGRLVVKRLKQDGWCIRPAVGRGTTVAVPAAIHGATSEAA